MCGELLPTPLLRATRGGGDGGVDVSMIRAELRRMCGGFEDRWGGKKEKEKEKEEEWSGFPVP